MILNDIVLKTRQRITLLKEQKSMEQVIKESEALEILYGFPFEAALRSPNISFICEVKKASPSKGVIAEDFPYIQIAGEYENAGADALSVLTEPYFFLGKDKYIKDISKTVNIPILRKDFIIDSYQIYESKLIGAEAVLLICAILDVKILREYISIAHNLGLSALVEAHTKEEIDMALSAGARIIGVNNRDLKTFEVDIENSIKLKKYVPEDILFVSESGIKERKDVEALERARVSAVLIGETLMRSNDKKEQIKLLRGD